MACSAFMHGCTACMTHMHSMHGIHMNGWKRLDGTSCYLLKSRATGPSPEGGPAALSAQRQSEGG
eukprot:351408-Chlamydomonas_euryale.AAC.4